MQPWRRQALRQPRRRTSTDKTPCEVGASRRSRNRKRSITSSISYGQGDAPQPAEDPEAVKKLQSGNDPPGRTLKRRGIWPPSDNRGTERRHVDDPRPSSCQMSCEQASSHHPKRRRARRRTHLKRKSPDRTWHIRYSDTRPSPDAQREPSSHSMYSISQSPRPWRNLPQTVQGIYSTRHGVTSLSQYQAN